MRVMEVGKLARVMGVRKLARVVLFNGAGAAAAGAAGARTGAGQS